MQPQNFSASLSVSDGISLPLPEYLTHILDQKSAQDIVVIDLAGKSDIADYMIVATGNSTTHIGALADHISRALKARHIDVLSVAGKPDNRWVLVDTAEVIVHIFHAEERGIYQIEKIWCPDFVEDEELETVH